MKKIEKTSKHVGNQPNKKMDPISKPENKSVLLLNIAQPSIIIRIEAKIKISKKITDHS